MSGQLSQALGYGVGPEFRCEDPERDWIDMVREDAELELRDTICRMQDGGETDAS